MHSVTDAEGSAALICLLYSIIKNREEDKINSFSPRRQECNSCIACAHSDSENTNMQQNACKIKQNKSVKPLVAAEEASLGEKQRHSFP